MTLKVNKINVHSISSISSLLTHTDFMLAGSKKSSAHWSVGILHFEDRLSYRMVPRLVPHTLVPYESYIAKRTKIPCTRSADVAISKLGSAFVALCSAVPTILYKFLSGKQT
jgi:hypothetical protein